MDKREQLAWQIVEWASMRCGPYAETHKTNMRIQLIKSGVNLQSLLKLQPRERMHDINLIMSGNMTGLFCKDTHKIIR